MFILLLVIVDTTAAPAVKQKFYAEFNVEGPDRGVAVNKRSRRLWLKQGENKSVLNIKRALHSVVSLEI